MSLDRPDNIVITGMGMVTSLGESPRQVWNRICAGECGVLGPMPALESPLPEGHTAAQAVDLPGDFEPHLPREARYLRWSILQALREAQIRPDHPSPRPQRCGIVLGTTLHGMRAGGQFLRTGDFRLLRDFLAASTLERAAHDLALAGDALTTCSACSSSLGSIALAVTLLRGGELDLVIAGGYDATSEYAYAGFNSLRLVARGPLMPFARGRHGMKLGEGYGIVVLERQGDAAERGARAIVRVAGIGESADAHHLTQPHPQGAGAAMAIESALRDAGLAREQVDLVAAHATGTPDNDAAEFAALSRVFGEDLPRVPVVAFKSHLGHTLGGAGAVELICSAMAIGDQLIPGCAKVADHDVEFDALNLSTGPARPGRVRATLNASLGFGGANTCVILTPPARAQAAGAPAIVAPPRDGRGEVLITGIGILLDGAVGIEPFIDRLNNTPPSDPPASPGSIPEEAYVHLLSARRVRRMSDYVKLTLAATTLARADAGLPQVEPMQDTPRETPWCAILGTTHGSASYCYQYYRQIVDEGLPAANPMLFAEGVPNAAAAHLSMMLALRGACQTIIGSRTSGLDALRLASLRIATGQWDRAIVSAAEEVFPIVNEAYMHCGLHARGAPSGPFTGTGGFVTGAGAVTLVLESADAARRRGARARGAIERTAAGRATRDGMPETVRQIVNRLGRCDLAFSSANATWVDRVEADALDPTGAKVETLYGRWPELFSAGPLASIAAGLLARRDFTSFNVLCTGYNGTSVGARLRRA